MTTRLGDTEKNGRLSLGGFSTVGSSVRSSSARKGIVLYSRPTAFSIVNGAADDAAQRDSNRQEAMPRVRAGVMQQ